MKFDTKDVYIEAEDCTYFLSVASEDRRYQEALKRTVDGAQSMAKVYGHALTISCLLAVISSAIHGSTSGKDQCLANMDAIRTLSTLHKLYCADPVTADGSDVVKH